MADIPQNEEGIPPLERRILAASLAFVLAPLCLIAFSVYRLGARVPTCVPMAPFTKAEIIQHAPDRYEVHLLARMWQFEPALIAVPKGSIVDFYVTSEDVTHGFHIHGTNVNLMVVPNVVNYAQARFDMAGKFAILCHEYCGKNHAQMRAAVEVR